MTSLLAAAAAVAVAAARTDNQGNPIQITNGSYDLTLMRVTD
jgi:hypothetical protein